MLGLMFAACEFLDVYTWMGITQRPSQRTRLNKVRPSTMINCLLTICTWLSLPSAHTAAVPRLSSGAGVVHSSAQRCRCACAAFITANPVQGALAKIVVPWAVSLVPGPDAVSAEPDARCSGAPKLITPPITCTCAPAFAWTREDRARDGADT